MRARSLNLRDSAEITRIGRRAVEAALVNIAENPVVPVVATQTVPQITADKNDYNPGPGKYFRITSDAARNITGIISTLTESEVTFFNAGAFTITFQHQNAGSSAANRLINNSGADVGLAADTSIRYWRDQTSQRWRQV